MPLTHMGSWKGRLSSSSMVHGPIKSKIKDGISFFILLVLWSHISKYDSYLRCDGMVFT